MHFLFIVMCSCVCVCVVAAYPSHGYSSTGSSSYSSQSWYGYPSAYPSYPATGSYWSRADGADSAQMVQYPVCPRKSTSFILEVSSVHTLKVNQVIMKSSHLRASTESCQLAHFS